MITLEQWRVSVGCFYTKFRNLKARHPNCASFYRGCVFTLCVILVIMILLCHFELSFFATTKLLVDGHGKLVKAS